MGEEQDIPRKLEYESLAEYDAFRRGTTFLLQRDEPKRI